MRHFNILLKQPELQAIASGLEAITASQAIWQAIAPQALHAHTHAGGIANRQLLVYADNNAVAAKLKLLMPNLLIRLEKQGLEITAIRVKVQVNSIKPAKRKPAKKLSREAAKNIAKLADKVSGSELGKHLKRLADKAE